jgi:AraC-like DNA-binding protein
MKNQIVKELPEWLNHLTLSELEFIHCRKVYSGEDWEGALNKLDSHLIFYVEKGLVEGDIDGKKVMLSGGDIVWMQPGCVRKFILNHKSSHTRNTRLRFRLSIKKVDVLFEGGLSVVKRNRRELERYLDLISEIKIVSGTLKKMKLKSLISAFATAFFDPDDDRDGTSPVFSPDKKNRIDEFISQNIFSGIQPADVARATGYSPDYFTRVFKSVYGEAPRTYLKNERLRSAAELLLETDMRLKEICAAMSEDDAGKFCRQFKELFKRTPGEYRKNGGVSTREKLLTGD